MRGDCSRLATAAETRYRKDVRRRNDRVAMNLPVELTIVERSETGGGDPDGSAGGAGGSAPRGIERSETGGGDPDGSAGGAGGSAPRGIERSETGGGDPDGSAGGAGGSAPRGIEHSEAGGGGP